MKVEFFSLSGWVEGTILGIFSRRETQPKKRKEGAKITSRILAITKIFSTPVVLEIVVILFVPLFFFCFFFFAITRFVYFPPSSFSHCLTFCRAFGMFMNVEFFDGLVNNFD